MVAGYECRGRGRCSGGISASRLATVLAEGMLVGVDLRYMLRVSDPIEWGILEAAIAEAARVREQMDTNLAVTIVNKLAEAF